MNSEAYRIITEPSLQLRYSRRIQDGRYRPELRKLKKDFHPRRVEPIKTININIIPSEEKGDSCVVINHVH